MTATIKESRLVSLAQNVGDRFGLWLVLALGSLLRFINLDHPHKLVFDETYYVKDAFTLSRLGYEGAWPKDPNAAFEAGSVDTFLTDPSYVVHPPLGKWIISLGINLFGAENSFGWRFSVALLGVASIGLLYLVAKRLLGSSRWALVAAFLLAIDGHAIVLSRTALLDGILAFFALLAFYCLLRDRDESMLQPWPRPWLLAMAVTLGAASAVKWSGLYILVAFALYALVSDLLRARRISQAAGIEKFNWTKNILWRGVLTFFVTFPAAVLTYLLSWTGWLVTAGGYYRDWVAASGSVPSWLAWIPQPLQALWHYHQQAYGFHVALHSSHPYAANPLGWLLMLRPTSFFYEGNDKGKNGCEFDGGCSSAITALGNPAIWWVAVVAVVLIAITWFKTRDRQAGLILLGLGAGYLPWLIYLNRTTFQFYSIVFLPWMLLALVMVLRAQVAGHSLEYQPRSSSRTLTYLIGTFALSLFFLPIWIGTTIPYWFWLIHMWIPSWI
jgi:dolichyl-phosphate-mannose--protein O-mannosyl transferase